MPDYVVHASRERARLRHRALADDAKKVRIMDALKDEKGIAGIRPGESSLLILLEPEADLARICGMAEQAVPELAQGEGRAGKPGKISCPARRGALPQDAKRKLWLRSLFAAGVTTVGLAAVGLHHLHAWAGGAFTALAAHHVWTRRKRI